MNKMPLPIHLLSAIPGFRMMGQTSFGGYCKIIWTWWENDCPAVLTDIAEFQSLSGMYRQDYERYRPKMEPVLLQSIEILKKYHQERRAITAGRSATMKKAQAIYQNRVRQAKYLEQTKGNIVDKHVNVNPTAINPSPQPFHEGWNLEKKNSPNIKKLTTIQPMLLDK